MKTKLGHTKVPQLSAPNYKLLFDQNFPLYILNHVPAVIASYNIKTGQYIFVNDSLKNILGYTSNEFLEKGLDFANSLVHPDDIPGIIAKNNLALKLARKLPGSKVFESYVNFEYRMRHKNGEWKWLHTDGSVCSRDDKGDIECVLNISVDITERKLKELEASEKLTTSEERYKTFVSQSTEGIWRFELEKPVPINLPPNEQIKLCFKYAYLAESNDAMARMYGFDKAEKIIGARLSQFLNPKDPRSKILLQKFIESGYRLVDSITVEKDSKGKDHYFSNNFTGVVQNGFIYRAWGIQRDITEKVKSEERKDEFIAVASHELKTPLTSLRMYSQLMKNKIEDLEDPDLKHFVIRFEEQVQNLTHLVRDLLDVSRIKEGKLAYSMNKFTLSSLMKEVVEDMQKIVVNHKLVLKNKLSVTVKGDEQRLRQVLVNLINNAARYSEEGKKIILDTRLIGKEIIISVKDYGTGIPEDQIEKVFDRFYQVKTKKPNKNQGLGLGLYMSKEIIEKHKGKIWVKSKIDKGSTFYFSLPVYSSKIR